MTTTPEIPPTMKRLVVTAPGNDLKSCNIEVQTDVPVPKPKSNQVLIKVIASAINPSDYGSWYRCKPEQCPYAMGKEGCGIVVSIGGGMSSYLRSISIGTKVGFVNLRNKQGAYSEYVVADIIGSVFPMPGDFPIENAASFFVNPYTAIGILDTVRQNGGTSFVHTAAASQLGQMIVKLAITESIDVINVVRREEQAELLKSLGAKYVVVTSNESWKDELKEKVNELGTTIAFDAVSGDSTGDLIDALPKAGTCYLYGGLAGKAQNINPMDLIYQKKKLKGFLLTDWLMNGGTMYTVPRVYSATNKVVSGLVDGWSSSQFLDTTMEKAHEDLIQLLDSNNSTGKKLRVRISTP